MPDMTSGPEPERGTEAWIQRQLRRWQAFAAEGAANEENERPQRPESAHLITNNPGRRRRQRPTNPPPPLQREDADLDLSRFPTSTPPDRSVSNLVDTICGIVDRSPENTTSLDLAASLLPTSSHPHMDADILIESLHIIQIFTSRIIQALADRKVQYLSDMRILYQALSARSDDPGFGIAERESLRAMEALVGGGRHARVEEEHDGSGRYLGDIRGYWERFGGGRSAARGFEAGWVFVAGRALVFGA